MTQPNTYLNITDTEYKINPNEFIILQSTLDSDYLKKKTADIPYNTSENIHNISYGTAIPRTDNNEFFEGDEEITIEEQTKMLSELKTGKNINENVFFCVANMRDKVIGNASSFWYSIAASSKNETTKNAKEIVFKTTEECSLYVLIYVFQDFYNELLSLHNLKISLCKGYEKFINSNENKLRSILNIFEQQGKKNMVEKIKNKQISLEDAILDAKYYLTDLDVWIFSTESKIQICLFNPNILSGTNVEWVIIGNEYNEKHYFIRSGAKTVNKPISYHLISPFQYITNLPKLHKTVNDALVKNIPNIIALDNYILDYKF